MAEGGTFPSLTGGSDAYVEHYCTPCEEDNVKEEAVKYCPECAEYLCSRCSRYHTKQKATKSHKLVEKQDAQQTLHAVKIKCRYHPDRDIEMYCGTHDMVYCLLCIATDHRNCDKVDKIEVGLKSNINQADTSQLLNELTNVKESLNDMKTKQTKHMSALEQKRSSINEHMEEVEQKMIQHIKKIKEKATHDVNEKYATMKEKHMFEINLASRTMEILNESSQQLQLIDQYTDEQTFVYLKLTKMSIAEANTIQEQSISKGISSLNFTERTEIEEFIKSVDTLGQVEENSMLPPIQKQYKVTTNSEINVKLMSDQAKCNISDLCQLPDGRILLTDQNNKKVKMLDLTHSISYHSIRDSCELEDFPTGICCVSENEVAVRLINDAVQFLYVSSCMSKTGCITIEGGKYYGMTYCNDRLWISRGPNGIYIYSKSGELIQSIDNVQENKIFKSVVQHMAVSGADTVFVADWSDGAAVLNKDGMMIRELRDSRLKGTRGVCAAADGTVFLCGNSSNNIVMFSKDGKCIEELVGKDFGLSYPMSMCIDKNTNSLVVSNEESNTLKIFKMVH